MTLVGTMACTMMFTHKQALQSEVSAAFKLVLLIIKYWFVIVQLIVHEKLNMCNCKFINSIIVIIS